jgi:hypothetical protein
MSSCNPAAASSQAAITLQMTQRCWRMKVAPRTEATRYHCYALFVCLFVLVVHEPAHSLLAHKAPAHLEYMYQGSGRQDSRLNRPTC